MDPDDFEAPQSPEQAPPSPDYVPGPEYPEYVAPSDDEIPVEDQPLPADASPTALSSGYESSEDDDDDEGEEASEEDEDEEENLAPADSGSTEALITEYASAPTPPSLLPSPLSSLSSPRPRILSPPLLLPPPHTSPTYASAPLGYRATMIQLRAASPLPVPSPPLLLPSADRRSDIPETNMPF
ncbi:hypothetical protein Tco_0137851 [Tanacetum coccineum]